MEQHNLSDLHAKLAATAFENVLGRAVPGTMAFVRCLTPDVIVQLVDNPAFSLNGWQIQRVADVEDVANRTITADQAVEMRENKGPAILLLVDTDLAGAGMDGIYSAAQEVDENRFFEQAWKLAEEAIAQHRSTSLREDAKLAISRSQGHGGRRSISPWIQFDYLVQVAAEVGHPGELLHLLSMWPAKPEPDVSMMDTLATSRLFIERLLSGDTSGLTPAQRINALNLLQPSQDQLNRLEKFVRTAATQPMRQAMESLAQQPDLWVNVLRMESSADEVQRLDLRSWRTKTGKVVKWSGLTEDPTDDANPPLFIMDSLATSARNYSKLSIQWSARPETVKKGAVQYQVRLLTDMDEEIASREVTHSARNYETCTFTNDDFSLLDEDALVAAKVVVSVVGNSDVDEVKSEEILIKYGDPPNQETSSVATKVRSLVEGVIELDSWETVSDLIAAEKRLPEDNKGFVTLRTPNPKKSYKVFRPTLIRQIEEQWAAKGGAIGRWQVRVRISGERAAEPTFIPLDDCAPLIQGGKDSSWQRVEAASRRMAELFQAVSGVAQIYDDRSVPFRNTVREYLLAWADLLEKGSRALTLVNTVEVQTLSGRTIGLIVLPNHPLRVAWHAAYDNLVLHAAFQQGASSKAIRDEFTFLDGAMFPTFLPGLEEGSTFVFADTLGFHAVGMVLDQDKEPKSAVAMLARALGESDTADSAPTVAQQSAAILGKEIQKYLDCHNTSQVLHIHSLRPGDGLTVARALGAVHKSAGNRQSIEEGDTGTSYQPSFVLDLYPADERKGLAGRFIAEAREKRRRGAGVVAEQDRWMLESLSLPGGINRPLLRWARRDRPLPESAAHLAIAFDTFESRVVATDAPPERPLYAYGLISFFDRSFRGLPVPFWQSVASTPAKGEKHPSDRVHTDRLLRIQKGVEMTIAHGMEGQAQTPALRTEITLEKTESLNELHQLCDWVITLDRNAGVEYFDSPRENRAIYDAYVIDAVPERDDLGCLQLITSTSNLDEVQNLLDDALDQMGLSHSRRNAEFLLENLKALSGRLAIRLTGQNAPSAELIGLAMSHANCRRAEKSDPAWVSLQNGFLIPVDDVLDLISPLVGKGAGAEQTGSSRVRPDLIYVSLHPRKGLTFQLIEVKYRRHLRAARMPDLLDRIDKQVRNMRQQWDAWFGVEEETMPFRSLRRAKLARVLRFYADKAFRHHLPVGKYTEMIVEIDRMVERGGDYPFFQVEKGDRGWIFCPEYTAEKPSDITPIGWGTQIFLFGPSLMNDLRSPIFESDHPTSELNDLIEIDPSPANEISVSVTQVDVQEEDEKEQGQEEEKIGELITSNEPASEPPFVVPSIILGQEIFGGTDVEWKLMIKGNPHLLIAGLPGMGKTTCLLNLCEQMIDNQVLPIIFSYHQDIDERLSAQVGDVRFLDYRGLGFNPLQVLDRSGFMPHLDVAGAMRDIFMAIYPELGDIQGNRIRTAIKDSFQELGWGDPNADLASLDEPSFRRFLEILLAEEKPDRGLRTLLARLTELDDYGFFAPSESSQSLWTETRPTVIRIHSTQNETLQQAFASLIFYGLYKDMFRRGPQERVTHCVIFDEAHRAARLNLLPTMAKECRKYGISLVVASQEAKDFNPSLFSAIANYLVLRLTDVDAKFLTRNVASSDQERVLIDKIKQMERFKALYFREGKRKPAFVALQSPSET